MQPAQNILLIKPASFGYNPETAESNAFQVSIGDADGDVRAMELEEFEQFAATLSSAGVNVIVFDDTPVPEKPDAVFPNNWVSFHEDGTVILYPMLAKNRRAEQRRDIIEELRKDFEITDVVDLSGYETENRFLEGTGSIVFDHTSKTAFACLSPRSDKGLLTIVCQRLGYTPLTFNAHDRAGQEIYHTNVMMCVADRFAVVCLESITDRAERAGVIGSLVESGHRVIDISFDQMENFAGNMLALRSTDSKDLIALSRRAFDSLREDQKEVIGGFCEMVPLKIDTIETVGGGSARCMIAEIFLPRKS